MTIAPAQGTALVAEILTRARELVEDGWCQGHAAADHCGRAVAPISAFACNWSAQGALERVWMRHEDHFGDALGAFERANLALSSTVGTTPQAWNDAEGRTLTEVLGAFEDALSSLGPQGEHSGRPVAD